MIDIQTIEEVKKRLVKAYNPLEIYLFGSYVWGHPDEDSDLDVLVIIEKYDKDHYHTLVDGHRALMDMDLAKDILVVSKEEFVQYSADIKKLYYKIKHEGKKIYARA
jgi:uncharacterized protein